MTAAVEAAAAAAALSTLESTVELLLAAVVKYSAWTPVQQTFRSMGNRTSRSCNGDLLAYIGIGDKQCSIWTARQGFRAACILQSKCSRKRVCNIPHRLFLCLCFYEWSCHPSGPCAAVPCPLWFCQVLLRSPAFCFCVCLYLQCFRGHGRRNGERGHKTVPETNLLSPPAAAAAAYVCICSASVATAAATVSAAASPCAVASCPPTCLC